MSIKNVDQNLAAAYFHHFHLKPVRVPAREEQSALGHMVKKTWVLSWAQNHSKVAVVFSLSRTSGETHMEQAMPGFLRPPLSWSQSRFVLV